MRKFSIISTIRVMGISSLLLSSSHLAYANSGDENFIKTASSTNTKITENNNVKLFNAALGLGSETLKKVNASEKYLSLLTAKLARAEKLSNDYQKAWESLYGNGKGAGTVGELNDSFLKLSKTKSILSNTQKQLASKKSKINSLIKNLNNGVQKGASVAGTVMDVATLASAMQTLNDDTSSLMDKMSASASAATVALTNSKAGAAATSPLILFDVTLTAVDFYADATREVATDNYKRMVNHKNEFRELSRRHIINLTIQNPNASKEQIVQLAKPEIKKLTDEYFETYRVDGEQYIAVFGKGWSKLAAGVGNKASNGVAVHQYNENLSLFTDSVHDKNSELYNMMSATASGAIKKVKALQDIAISFETNSQEINIELDSYQRLQKNTTKASQVYIDAIEGNQPQDGTPKEEQATDTPKAEEKKARKEEILANANDKKEKQAEQDRIDRENEQLRRQREEEAIEEQIAKLVAKQDMNNNVVTDAEARIKEEKNQIAVSKYEDLEIVDKSLKSFRSELKKLSLRSDDKASLTKLQRERSTLIEGAKIVRQLQLKRLKVENLTRSQKIKLTLMGSALGYTSAGRKPVWQTVADNIRFTANKIISKIGSIDRTVARLNPLSPAEERKLKLVKQKEVELTNNKIKILNTIKRSEEKIRNYETELVNIRNEMRSNERTLTQLGYDLENYQAPYFTTSPRSDWANYDSPYDAIEVSDLTDEIKAEINPDQSSGPIDSAPVAQPNISTPGVTETGTNAVGSDPGVGGGTAPTGNGQSFTEPGSTEGNSAGEQASGRPGEGDEEESVTGEGTTEAGDQGADSNNSDGTRTFDRITTNKLGTGVFNTDSLEPKDENNQIKLSSRIGGGSIKQIETFDASNYFYTKLGKWSAMAGTPSNFSQGGYFATIDGTPTTAIQSLSGSATYSGNIIGEFVKSDGFRDDARGLIELSVNFSNQSVDAQFQLGHNCSSTGGGGPSGCGTVSRVAKVTEPINDYLSSNGAGFGSHSDAARTSGESIVGIFGGPNGQEIAGDVSLADNGGIYNGVFQSNRGDINEENDDDNGTVMVAMSTQTTDRYIIDDRLRMVENPGDQNSGFEFGISPDRGGGSVLTSERFSLGEYSYTNWGRWKATNLSPETHLAGGYWVSGHVTPENVIHDKTGSASYSGKMIGDFVSFEGAREAAHGDIALNANFTSNIVSGQMQWGHGGGAVSPLVEIYTGISGNGDFSMSSRNENTGLYYGVNGQFIGSTAQEVGGASWMHTQEGSYNGVFRAKQ